MRSLSSLSLLGRWLGRPRRSVRSSPLALGAPSSSLQSYNCFVTEFACRSGTVRNSRGNARFLTLSASAIPTSVFHSDPARGYLPGSSRSSSHCFFSSSTRTSITAAATASGTPEDAPKDSRKTSAGTPFLLADIGEGIKEVELLQWYCQPGDSLQQFDKVVEVQSDKATVEITSRYDGVVAALCAATGDMVQVGQPLLYFHNENDDSSSNSAAADAPAIPVTASTTTTTSALEDLSLELPVPHAQEDRLRIPTVASHFHLASDDDFPEDDHTGNHTHHGSSAGKFLTSPAVRQLGRQYKLDLATIHGSGPQGRLLKSDVLTYLKEQGLLKATLASDESITTRQAASTPTSTSTTTIEEEEEDEIVTLRGYNRLMVKSMTAALETPHMGFGDELDMTRLLQCRRELKDAGTSVSILSFLLKAISLALVQYPVCNAVIYDLEACQLRLIRQHNLGVAMDTPRGLVVPVVHHVQSKSLTDIQADLDRLKATAAESKFTPADLTTPTFTMSNIGATGNGGTYMNPVIVPPQLAMGAVGQIQRLPRFEKGGTSMQVCEAHIMTVSWAADHRFLDGATLARFHGVFKGFVENPVSMLVHLK